MRKLRCRIEQKRVAFYIAIVITFDDICKLACSLHRFVIITLMKRAYAKRPQCHYIIRRFTHHLLCQFIALVALVKIQIALRKRFLYLHTLRQFFKRVFKHCLRFIIFSHNHEHLRRLAVDVQKNVISAALWRL